MKFNTWLLGELQKRQWKQADLVRLSGLTSAAISKYVNGRIPDDAALIKLAKAFNLPPETIYRAAGVLPSAPEKDRWVEDMSYRLSHLDPRLRGLVEMLIDVVEKAERNGF